MDNVNVNHAISQNPLEASFITLMLFCGVHE